MIEYDPAANPEIVYGRLTVPDVPEAVPDQLTTPDPDPVIWILPVDVAQVEGLFTVPRLITGDGETVTTVGEDVAEQPFPLVYVTVYDPEVVTVIVCEVAEVDQTLPDGCDEVKFTEPPAQKVVEPLAEMEGVDGFAFTVTTVAADVAEHPEPFVTVTVYEPAVLTVIDCVVAPVDHALPVADDEVSVTEPPEQKVVGPPAEMVGVDGLGFIVTTVGAEVAEQPLPFVYVTV